ncbi:ABC transporter permease [Neptuniibacter sp. 1_MG-2023]|jgi:NitT/TauT family transport system permease protein|uniref:ABC transporter permease n=1 Tax=Neptuniibacter sp. 1_MG-2023 TaxID=3062662 RepID=UPI0026E41E92|nr:ABC transporter permease subunit [Neptuniibacter sp. 1_MG-2023]MDO6594472.1 ABC transporter permease subunit [Neptuniibacter sp. 1_MG-2023]
MKSSRFSDQVIALTCLLAGWWLVASFVSSPLLPAPLEVFEALSKEFREQRLVESLLVTLQRVVISFVFAMLLGGIIGVLMGRFRLVNRILDPILIILLNIPALVVIILLYIWFGLVEVAAVAAVIINKLPNVAVTLREGGRMFDHELEEMSVMYKFSFQQKLVHIWWPQLFPYIMIATRSGLALIWKIVLVVELLGRSNGVGFQLHLAFQSFDVATILAYSLAFISVVQLIEWFILQPLDRKASRWQKGSSHV